MERLLVAANLTAKCPHCGTVLIVILGSYVDSRRCGCAHVVEVSRIDGQIYVAYERPKDDNHTALE